MTNLNAAKNIPLGQSSSFMGLQEIVVIADLDLAANKTTDVISSGVYIPAGCDVVDVKYYTEKAVTSGGSMTFAMGTDSTSDPDNFLNDEAVATFATAANVKDGIPRLGTDATKIAYTTKTQIYWKSATAAPTAGRIRASILVRRYA
jgi:hypothetical protein